MSFRLTSPSQAAAQGLKPSQLFSQLMASDPNQSTMEILTGARPVYMPPPSAMPKIEGDATSLSSGGSRLGAVDTISMESLLNEVLESRRELKSTEERSRLALSALEKKQRETENYARETTYLKESLRSSEEMLHKEQIRCARIDAEYTSLKSQYRAIEEGLQKFTIENVRLNEQLDSEQRKVESMSRTISSNVNLAEQLSDLTQRLASAESETRQEREKNVLLTVSLDESRKRVMELEQKVGEYEERMSADGKKLEETAEAVGVKESLEKSVLFAWSELQSAEKRIEALQHQLSLSTPSLGALIDEAINNIDITIHSTPNVDLESAQVLLKRIRSLLILVDSGDYSSPAAAVAKNVSKREEVIIVLEESLIVAATSEIKHLLSMGLTRNALAVDEHLAEQEAMIRAMETEIHILRQRDERKQPDVFDAAIESKLSSLSHTNADQRRTIASLEGQVSELQRRNDEMQAYVIDAQKQMMSARHEAEMAVERERTEGDRMREELERVKGDVLRIQEDAHGDLERTRAEAQAYKEECERLTEEIMRGQEEQQAIGKVRDDYEELESRMRAQLVTIQEKERELRERENQVSELAGNMNELKMALTAEREEHRGVMEQLNVDMKLSEAKLSHTIQMHEASITSLTESLHQERRTVAGLQGELEARGEEMERAKAEARGVQAEIEAANASVANHATVNNQLNTQIQEYRQLHADALAAKRDAEEALFVAMGQAGAGGSRASLLESENLKLQSHVRNLEIDLNNRTDELEARIRSLADVTKKYQEAVEAVRALEVSIERLQHHTLQLDSNLATVTRERDELISLLAVPAVSSPTKSPMRSSASFGSQPSFNKPPPMSQTVLGTLGIISLAPSAATSGRMNVDAVKAESVLSVFGSSVASAGDVAEIIGDLISKGKLYVVRVSISRPSRATNIDFRALIGGGGHGGESCFRIGGFRHWNAQEIACVVHADERGNVLVCATAGYGELEGFLHPGCGDVITAIDGAQTRGNFGLFLTRLRSFSEGTTVVVEFEREEYDGRGVSLRKISAMLHVSH